VLCGMAQRILAAMHAAESPHIPSSSAASAAAGGAATSFSSAYLLMFSSLGLDWRQVWRTQFADARRGHLHSEPLAVIAPMLLTHLWQLMQHMHPHMQLNTIEHMIDEEDEQHEQLQ